MSFTHWLFPRPASHRNTPAVRPTLEALEDRWLPSTLTVLNSTLSGNAAVRGGGISNVGSATVSGSTLSDNSATQGGGGIWNGVGTLTVKNTSSITGNTAPAGYGADVYNLSVVYLDSSSTIGFLNGNPAVPI